MKIAFIPPMTAILEAITRTPLTVVPKWLNVYYPRLRDSLSNVIDMRDSGIKRYNSYDKLGAFASKLTEAHINGIIEFENLFDVIVGKLNDLSLDLSFDEAMDLVKPLVAECDYALINEEFDSPTLRKMYFDGNEKIICFKVSSRSTIEQ